MFVVLDFIDPDGGPQVRRLYRNPVTTLLAYSPGEVRALLEEVDEATRIRGMHAAGYLAYEAAPAFDRAFIVRSGNRLPLAWFGLFERFTPIEVADRANLTFEPPGSWAIDLPRDEYDAAVAHIRNAIAAGRTYQVNLTARLRAAFRGDARSWYEELRRAQGAGFHAYLDLGDHAILSASPELFFARRGAYISARPMKGTRPRGRYEEEDRARGEDLQQADKDRAENLMIVDLLRNDLGRIAQTGSVEVTHLHQLERYPTVWQLTSTIRALLPRPTRLPDIFTALFPCGSVTGAPKISTMQIIAELERSPREVYCGAVGVVEPGGDCTFNVPIRTTWLDRRSGIVEYGAGSGVVWDSQASVEHDELRAKAAILAEPWPHFELLETMRLDDGVFIRAQRHLDRLRSSAAYFGYPYRPADIEAALASIAAARPSGSCRVRLLLARSGTVRTELHPAEPPLEEAQPFDLANSCVQSSNRFLFHKTTNRAVYERALAQKPGVLDVLLWNERGELTEFTRGNLVLEIAGQRLTPQHDAGLLAGTLRAELLDSGVIEEATLLITDLSRASRVWLINSVRGWVQMTRVPQSVVQSRAEAQLRSERWE